MSRERGLILTKENRLASVEGRKTQTRRIIVPQPEIRRGSYDHGHWSYHTSKPCIGPTCSVDKGHPDDGYWIFLGRNASGYHTSKSGRHKPPYQVGDHLYMLEPYQILGEYSFKRNFMVLFLDDGREHRGELTLPSFRKWQARKFPYRKTSARFMYKSLARHWFEVTKVRVENGTDISSQDCFAEGISTDILPVDDYHPECICYVTVPDDNHAYVTPQDAFKVLWDSINAKRGYEWSKGLWRWVYDYKRISKKSVLICG